MLGSVVGVVIVLEGVEHDPGALLRVVADVLGLGAAPEPVVPGSTVWHVDDAVPEGVLSVQAHAIGFTTLSLRMSSSAALPGQASAEAAMARVVALLIAAGERLTPMFGYFTRYEDQLDERWLTNQVFIPLLTEEWEHIQSSSYHMILLGPAFPSEARGAARAEGSWGALLVRGPTDNPFDI